MHTLLSSPSHHEHAPAAPQSEQDVLPKQGFVADALQLGGTTSPFEQLPLIAQLAAVKLSHQTHAVELVVFAKVPEQVEHEACFQQSLIGIVPHMAELFASSVPPPH